MLESSREFPLSIQNSADQCMVMRILPEAGCGGTKTLEKIKTTVLSGCKGIETSLVPIAGIEISEFTEHWVDHPEMSCLCSRE